MDATAVDARVHRHDMTCRGSGERRNDDALSALRLASTRVPTTPISEGAERANDISCSDGNPAPKANRRCTIIIGDGPDDHPEIRMHTKKLANDQIELRGVVMALHLFRKGA